LKTNRFGTPEKKVDTVAVLGAGLMGAGIAQVTATKGMKVLLKDRDQKGVSRGEQQIYNNLTQRVRRRRMSEVQRDGHMANVVPLTEEDAHWREQFSHADMVIEAVFEDLELKKSLLQEIEQYIPEHCVMASNTSQLPISKIAAASKRPEKVVGMHYFSPVDKMPLLEVITTEQTSKDTAASAVQMGLRQGKTVIVVRDAPGFYTTRVLASLSAEGAGLLLEGVPAHDLDKHLRDFGYPVGLVSLLDEVGIDVASHIVKDLSVSLGDRVTGGADSGLINEMVQKGFCGRKSGKGFYLYDQPKQTSLMHRLTGKKSTGKPINPEALALIEKYRSSTDSSKLPAEEIQHRMVARMTNEVCVCVCVCVCARVWMCVCVCALHMGAILLICKRVFPVCSVGGVLSARGCAAECVRR
jgi:enoyl-CoA hydratase / long-chain 3-hydroxyacyl-CoA dehydrogenase